MSLLLLSVMIVLTIPTTFVALVLRPKPASNPSKKKHVRRTPPVAVAAIRPANRRAYLYVTNILDDAENGTIPSTTDFDVAAHALDTSVLDNPVMAKGFLREAFDESRSEAGLGTCIFNADQILKQLAR